MGHFGQHSERCKKQPVEVVPDNVDIEEQLKDLERNRELEEQQERARQEAEVARRLAQQEEERRQREELEEALRRKEEAERLIKEAKVRQGPMPYLFYDRSTPRLHDITATFV
jgi:hypothetical protein